MLGVDCLIRESDTVLEVAKLNKWPTLTRCDSSSISRHTEAHIGVIETEITNNSGLYQGCPEGIQPDG